MLEAKMHSISGGLAVVYSARCLGKDTPNEDAAALISFDKRSGVLVVADGMGGCPRRRTGSQNRR